MFVPGGQLVGAGLISFGAGRLTDPGHIKESWKNGSIGTELTWQKTAAATVQIAEYFR